MIRGGHGSQVSSRSAVTILVPGKIYRRANDAILQHAGPCNSEIHYMVPAEPRLPEAGPLIDRRQYFAGHPPRQTGKTTTLRALVPGMTRGVSLAADLASIQV